MKKRIILIAIAVVLAVMGTFAVYSYGKSADKRALKSTKSTTVLVATKPIPAGTTWSDTVKGDYFSPQNFPVDSVPASALTHSANAGIGKDAVALAEIAPGQFVLREAFGTKTAQTGALQIPKGLVAISVQLPANAEVAGYIGPDAEVSIFVTGKYTTAEDDVTAPILGSEVDITKTVIARAGVLAVSEAPVTEVDGSKDGSSSATSPLVTIALTQRDAERVVLAQHVGELYLALLSPSSTVSADDPGVKNEVHISPTPIFVK